MMGSEGYARAIGELFLDLKQLEWALRHFLYATNSTAPVPTLRAVGQVLPNSPITGHEPLGYLIEAFNRAVRDAKHEAFVVDPKVAEVGDALLQGRIWGDAAEPPVRIVKFGPPANGLVSCLFDSAADLPWLEAQTARVQEAAAKVTRAGQEIHPTWWTPAAAA